MQFSSSFSLLALVSIASAATSFGILTIASGTDLQYNKVIPQGDNFVASTSSGDGPTFVLNDDGSLVDSSSKKYITINDKKDFVQTDKADKQFSISEGTNLAYKKSTTFAVASDKKINIGSGSNVVLYLAGQKDASNIYPGGATSTSAAPKSSATPKATSTAAAKPTSSPAPAGETKFGVVSVASGTKFQYAAIKKVDSHPHVFSVGGDEGKDLELTLKSDGTLVDQDGRGIFLDTKSGELGDVAPFGRQAATNGFSIKDSHLVHDGKDNWKACPSGDNKFSLANNDCTGGTAIALHVVDQKSS